MADDASFHETLPSHEVRLRNVVAHHALSMEERAIYCDGEAHHVDVASPVAVEEGNDDLAQLSVQRVSVAVATPGHTGGQPDRPARDSLDAVLQLPSVENAQRGHPVQGGLHAACPGGFHRRLGRI